MDYSLFFFSAGESGVGRKYRSIIEWAKFADQHSFKAVWLPERHFTNVGCLFPSPAVIHAALAMETRQIRLRAGSVVLPLHDVKRVAEEWAVVDNLSNGRVDVSFAVGWHPNDFAFFPERYRTRYAEFPEAIRIFRKLWKGERIEVRNGLESPVQVRTYPTPVQVELPIWVTATGDRRTFKQAGLLGANLLTHLFTQSLSQLRENINVYRDALCESGFSADDHIVTVMLHTHVYNESGDFPVYLIDGFSDYLRRGGQELLPALKASTAGIHGPDALPESEFESGLDIVVGRLVGQQRVLFGDVQRCLSQVRELESIGVDEIACHIDFGLDEARVIEGLTRLDELRQRSSGHWKEGVKRKALAVQAIPPSTPFAELRARCSEGLADDRLRRVRARLCDVPIAIAGVWSGRDECLTRVICEEDNNPSDKMIDVVSSAALIASLAMIDGDARSRALLSAIGECILAGELPGALWLHCAIRSSTTECNLRLVQVTAYCDDGTVVAKARDVEVILEPAPDDLETAMFFTPTWVARSDSFSIRSAKWQAARDLWSTESDKALSNAVNLYAPTRERIRKLTLTYILNALVAITPGFQDGACFDLQDLTARCGGINKRLWIRLLEVLVSDGWLSKDDAGWHVSHLPNCEMTEQLEHLLDECSFCSPELELLDLCGRQLVGILTGETCAIDVLFSPEGLSAIRNFYCRGVLVGVFHNALGRAVATEVESRGGCSAVKILEIGGGTGATTASVFAHQKSEYQEYCFTDISPYFVAEAMRTFSNCANFTAKMLDIEQEPIRQGLAAHSFDIVIASNVLHVTASIQKSLEHIHQLLKPSGLLLLLETTTAEPVLDLIFGLLPGWWRFEDLELRPDHPLLSRQKWSSVLETSGFASVELWPSEPGASQVSETLIAARRHKEHESDRVSSGGDRYLILCADDDLGEAISAEFRAAGHLPALFSPDFLRGQSIFTGGDDADQAEVTATLAHMLGECSSECAGLIYVLQCEVGAPLHQELVAIPTGVLSLVRAVLALKDRQIGRLSIVTVGAREVENTTIARESLACGSIPGLVRGIQADLGENWVSLVDLDPNESAAINAAFLYHQIERDVHTDAALRRGVSYEQHFVTAAGRQENVVGRYLSNTSTYLVTGGLGGLGAHVACWLAERGAAFIALFSRPVRDAAQAHDRAKRASVIQSRLRRIGAQVRVLDVDVSDAPAMGTALQILADDGFPPIAGVTHLAGTWSERRVEQWSKADFAAALEAKVAGGYVLHNLFASQPLEFFVLFSSLSSFFPVPGQTAYAAANSFLDALAAERRRLGLASMSINWGPWSETGFGETPFGKASHLVLAANGIGTLLGAHAPSLFDTAMAMNRYQVGIVRVEPRKLSQSTLPWLKRARGIVAELLPIESSESREDVVLDMLGLDELCEMLILQLRPLISPEGKAISGDSALSSLGLDSLSTIVFKARIASQFKVNVEPTPSTTLRQIATMLLERTLIQDVLGTDGAHTRSADKQ